MWYWNEVLHNKSATQSIKSDYRMWMYLSDGNEYAKIDKYPMHPVAFCILFLRFSKYITAMRIQALLSVIMYPMNTCILN